jgi:hypothetical protein
VFILKRTVDDGYEQTRDIKAQFQPIFRVALNSDASVVATVCCIEDIVTLWDVKQGLHVPT